MTITDAQQLVAYDVVTAGPRFVVTGRGAASGQPGDEDDGFVSLPYRFDHHVRSARPDMCGIAGYVSTSGAVADARTRVGHDRDAAAPRSRRYRRVRERTGRARGGAAEHHRRGGRPSADRRSTAAA